MKVYRTSLLKATRKTHYLVEKIEFINIRLFTLGKKIQFTQDRTITFTALQTVKYLKGYLLRLKRMILNNIFLNVDKQLLLDKINFGVELSNFILRGK